MLTEICRQYICYVMVCERIYRGRLACKEENMKKRHKLIWAGLVGIVLLAVFVAVSLLEYSHNTWRQGYRNNISEDITFYDKDARQVGDLSLAYQAEFQTRKEYSFYVKKKGIKIHIPKVSEYVDIQIYQDGKPIGGKRYTNRESEVSIRLKEGLYQIEIEMLGEGNLMIAST